MPSSSSAVLPMSRTLTSIERISLERNSDEVQAFINKDFRCLRTRNWDGARCKHRADLDINNAVEYIFRFHDTSDVMNAAYRTITNKHWVGQWWLPQTNERERFERALVRSSDALVPSPMRCFNRYGDCRVQENSWGPCGHPVGDGTSYETLRPWVIAGTLGMFVKSALPLRHLVARGHGLFDAANGPVWRALGRRALVVYATTGALVAASDMLSWVALKKATGELVDQTNDEGDAFFVPFEDASPRSSLTNMHEFCMGLEQFRAPAWLGQDKKTRTTVPRAAGESNDVPIYHCQKVPTERLAANVRPAALALSLRYVAPITADMVADLDVEDPRAKAQGREWFSTRIVESPLPRRVCEEQLATLGFFPADVSARTDDLVEKFRHEYSGRNASPSMDDFVKYKRDRFMDSQRQASWRISEALYPSHVVDPYKFPGSEGVMVRTSLWKLSDREVKEIKKQQPFCRGESWPSMTVATETAIATNSKVRQLATAAAAAAAANNNVDEKKVLFLREMWEEFNVGLLMNIFAYQVFTDSAWHGLTWWRKRPVMDSLTRYSLDDIRKVVALLYWKRPETILVEVVPAKRPSPTPKTTAAATATAATAATATATAAPVPSPTEDKKTVPVRTWSSWVCNLFHFGGR